MYWLKSEPLRKRMSERNKKRDSDTERAHDCPKWHANYGPSSPVSIPIFGESVVSSNCAILAQIKRAKVRGFRRRLERCVAAQGGHIELYGKARVWHIFFVLCAGRKTI